MTPMKLTVTAYITQQIQAKQPKPRGNNKQAKPTVYGEVLTRDDIVARLEEQEKEKTDKVAEKAAKKAEKEAEREEKKEERDAKKAEREAEREAKKAEREAKKREKEMKKAEKVAGRKTRQAQSDKIKEVSDEEEISKADNAHP